MNMENYEETYNNFDWKQAEKEIDFFDNKLNIAYNMIDRHCKDKGDKVALYWEGEDASKEFTYEQLRKLSNKFANILKKYDIKKGDRVFIFLPRVPELYVSVVGTLKAGGIVGTLFPAFQPQGVGERLRKGEVKYLVTNKELKKRVDEVRDELPNLEHMILVDDDDGVDYQKEMEQASEDFEISKMDPEDPAIMLFTSSTSYTPISGVVLSHKALVHQHITTKYVLDLQEEDKYWCTADPGWVTGIVYGIIGPWSMGMNTIAYEGRFSAEKWYSLIEKHKVNVWYTAPTAIRMLKASGDSHKNYDFSSLRHICSVGEALDPNSIEWFKKAFNLPVHDTYWQTETGAMVITNFPCLEIKPGSMGKPVPGIKAMIVDDDGNELPDNTEGNIALDPDFPGVMIDVWNNEKMFNSYFKNNLYYTGDKGYRDKDGYFWFVGRSDDIIKTAGERVGPFEVESALADHPSVVEAGVIGKPDELRGEIIKAFVVLEKGVEQSDDLIKDIQTFVKKKLAGHAYPREIEFVEKLPKNRSGKIVRRILKAKEMNWDIGDTSTLMD